MSVPRDFNIQYICIKYYSVVIYNLVNKLWFFKGNFRRQIIENDVEKR